MMTKCNIARRIASEGIPVIIANGKREDILLKLVDDPAGTLCTRFLPAEKSEPDHRVSARREIVITADAEKEIRMGHPRSLNAGDVLRCGGEFFRDELVRITNGQGENVGCGKALCSAAELTTWIENNTEDNHPVVHYDYLFLD